MARPKIPVSCLETGKIFESQREAAEYLKVTTASLNGAI